MSAQNELAAVGTRDVSGNELWLSRWNAVALTPNTGTDWWARKLHP